MIVTFYFEKKRAFATGLAVCGSGLGTFIFAPVSQFLVDEYGWKGAVLIEAGILLNCCVFGLLFRPLTVDSSRKPLAEQQDEIQMMPVNGTHVEDAISPVHKNLTHLMDSNGSRARAQTVSSVISLPREVALMNGSSDSPADHSIRAFSSDMWLHKFDEDKPKNHHLTVSPMARKDAFYSGSLLNIPLYRSNPALYNRSILSLAEESDESREGSKCHPLTKCCRQSLHHLTLLKDPIFLLFTISNFLTSLGFCVPYIYLPDLAIQLGIGRSEAAFLISVIGIANTVGRVVFGWLSDLKCVDRLVLYNTVLTLCGISTALCAFCVIYPLLIVYAAAFGMFIGEYSSGLMMANQSLIMIWPERKHKGILYKHDYLICSI